MKYKIRENYNPIFVRFLKENSIETLKDFMNRQIYTLSEERNKQYIELKQDWLFNQLQNLNIAKVTVEFSGGDDDGGVNETLALDIDNNDASAVLEDNEHLYEYLHEPIYEKYGSFAGSYFVTGDLIWNVKDRTFTMGPEKYQNEDYGDESEIWAQ